VEANLTAEIAQTTILPAAVRFQTELAQNVGALTVAGVEADTADLLTISALVGDLRAGLAGLRVAVAGAHELAGIAEATYLRDEVIPAMDAVRAAADALEEIVADDLWALPTYQEMLYIL
jgi:glutamine synthetase